MAKKKLMIIVSTLRGGGQERVATALTYLLADVYDMKVLIFDSRDPVYQVSCDYHSLELYSDHAAGKLSRLVVAVKRVLATKKIKNEWSPDICISFGPAPDYANVLSSKKERTYLSIRGFATLERAGRLTRMFNNILYVKATGIICVSKVMTQAAQAMYPKHAQKFHTLYNPHDHENIENLKQLPLKNYQHLFEGGNQVIMALGSYRKVKGQWHLIKAFAQLKKKYPNAKLLILGGESDRLGRLRQLVADLKLENEIILGDFETNPFNYLARSAIFVLSSLNEGLPNALLEAMSCNLPIVAADCKTGPREILSDGELKTVAKEIEMSTYGILIPPLDEVENYDASQVDACQYTLAEAMEIYLQNPELAEQYRQKALERIDLFSKQRCKDELLFIFER